ncbi:hypothetical protein B0H15DRAFT_945269 [Mycena belliarum]|uniref:Uncharacterized protein n=1 Tax=Mycena belliarum TaxID=1033014 RepID=A0AAD6UFQ7_9AGAR|nr:hypothetical protein B0H15DRAFT_945269 [Mycena belliae]
MSGRLTHREMLSYGLKPGEPWAEQRRELERAFDRADRSDRGGVSRRSMSTGGLPSGHQTQAVQRQYSVNSTGHDYARHSGYGSGHQLQYAFPQGRTGYPQDNMRLMQYREPPVSSRMSSPAPGYSSRTYDRGYPPSTYTSSTYRSHSGSSRYSGYATGSSTGYAPRSFYQTDDEDYTQGGALSSGGSERHHSSGYAETTFVVEPSDSGSEASYSGEHSSYGDLDSERGASDSGYSGSEGDSVYSEGADDEYDDFDDDEGSYSDGGDWGSDD